MGQSPANCRYVELELHNGKGFGGSLQIDLRAQRLGGRRITRSDVEFLRDVLRRKEPMEILK